MTQLEHQFRGQRQSVPLVFQVPDQEVIPEEPACHDSPQERDGLLFGAVSFSSSCSLVAYADCFNTIVWPEDDGFLDSLTKTGHDRRLRTKKNGIRVEGCKTETIATIMMNLDRVQIEAIVWT